METSESDAAGTPTHPDHDAWVLELGRVTRGAAKLAMICFDIARIVGGVDADEMYDDPLGGLQHRLRQIDSVMMPLLPEFMAALDTARHTRNDVMHAFLVKDGLLRRSAQRGYDRDFYSVRSLAEAKEQIEVASRLGNRILYANGGAEVEAWRQRD